jgi:hypothetical protein
MVRVEYACGRHCAASANLHLQVSGIIQTNWVRFAKRPKLFTLVPVVHRLDLLTGFLLAYRSFF